MHSIRPAVCRPSVLSVLFLVFLISVLSAEQPPNPKQADFPKLEGALADAERNHDAGCLQQTFADDLIYVAYNGVQLSKQKLLGGLSQLKISGYSMKNFSSKQLGPGTVLLTYDLEVKGSIMGSDLPTKSHATSIWENRGDRWLLVYHSETPQKQSLFSRLFF